MHYVMKTEKITADNDNRDLWSKGLKAGLTVLAGAAAGIAIYELIRRKNAQNEASKTTTLVDTIKVIENGVVTRMMTFGWDNDEFCSWAKMVTFDAEGNGSEEKLIELEYAEDRILISESTGDEDMTPVFTTVLLDEYGMAKAFSKRSRSGRETRWDGTIIGAELKELVSEEVTGTLDWSDGNVRSVACNEAVLQQMTYYKSIENHIFPDLNYLALGFTSDMLLTHILGTRTRNFLSTLEVIKDEEIAHYTFSYLFDAQDRPLQIHQELSVLDKKGDARPGAAISRTDYDLTYVVR